MSHANPTPSWLFNLEGTFLKFMGKDLDKPKSIVVEVEQEQMAIQLPKALRTTVRGHLQPGDRVHCVGRSQIDFADGIIKLQAYQLFPLSPVNGKPVALPPAAAPLPLPAVQGVAAVLEKKPAKILICQKSGCQKRGGRQLVAALERVLRERQLQGQVKIQYTSCQKRCSKAPNLTIMPGKHHYDRLRPENLSALVEEHFCIPQSRASANHVDA